MSKIKVKHSLNENQASQANQNRQADVLTSVPEQGNQSSLQAQLQTLQKQLQENQLAFQQAQERERRALADYQNLVRRNREERIAVFKLAGKELMEKLLPALDNLNKAAEHLNDQGLNMVVQELWRQLKEYGVEEIEVMGKKFDVNTMEAIEKKGKGEKVVAVMQRGYILNGEVLQHAKVVLG